MLEIRCQKLGRIDVDLKSIMGNRNFQKSTRVKTLLLNTSKMAFNCAYLENSLVYYL